MASDPTTSTIPQANLPKPAGLSVRRFLAPTHAGSAKLGSQGSVLTIGAFDGVHRGHQALVDQVVKLSNMHGLRATAMIFEPQPFEYFSPDKAPPRLMRLREKVHALMACGMDEVVCLRFNHALSTLSSEAFIVQVLQHTLRTKHLVVGDDFRFGAGRRGDFALLQSMAASCGYSVMDTHTQIDELCTDAQRISSTRIRQLLQQGDLTHATALLGKSYTVIGRVAYGKQVGRTMGFPTANIHLGRARPALSGVFAVIATVKNRRYCAVANIGMRPTLGDIHRPLLEVHLLNAEDDLNVYGQCMTVAFEHKIRSEQKFHSLSDLQAQIQKDTQQAITFFNLNDNN